MAEQILFFLVFGGLVLWFASKNAKTPKRRGIYLGILITLFGLIFISPDIKARIMNKEYSSGLGEDFGFIAVSTLIIGVTYIIYCTTRK
jgi:hypothetical protein